MIKLKSQKYYSGHSEEEALAGSVGKKRVRRQGELLVTPLCF